jgi:hypothetical protein
MSRIFQFLLLGFVLFSTEGYISKGIFTGRLRRLDSNVRCPSYLQRGDMSVACDASKFAVTANTISTLVGTSTILISPVVASAYAEPSAREALQLLSGYQTQTPNWFTWGTLAVLAYILAFEIWKKVLAAW